IDLANASAQRAFTLSTETLTGKATYQVSGGPQGVPEQVYADLKRSGWALPAAPVVSAYVSSPELGSHPLQLLGIDPFSDAPFRNFLGQGTALPLDQLTAFLARPGAVLLSRSLALRYDLKAGDPLTILEAGHAQPAFIAGLLDPADSLSQRTLDGMILADISTAQELTGTNGYLSRIDLILPVGNVAIKQALEKGLPQGLLVTAASARSDTLDQMTAAFRVNLSALSLLALVVGLFLIYNTMTFSVVQRRELFGTLRCLGVTRQEIFWLVMGEAALVGLAGAILGTGLGILFGQGTIRMVSQTINDLYFTTTVQAASIPPASLFKGILLGVLATMLTAAFPAWEAASVPPRYARLRSGLESKSRQNVAWAAVAGVGVLGTALLLFLAPTSNLYLGFSAALLVVLGAALLSAGALVLLVNLLAGLTARLFGLVGRLAPRSLLNSLSRTAVAVTALMVAVAVTIGVSIMIDSFRHTVVVWLQETLQSDIYISAPVDTATTPLAPVDPQVIEQLQTWPGVKRVDTLRATTVQAKQGQVNLSATDNPQLGFERLFYLLDVAPAQVWPCMLAGEVLVSEPLANRLGIRKAGDSLQLNTPQGWRNFRVMGIYYDYASSEGTVLMALQYYHSLWDDPAITAIGVRLEPGQNADQVVRTMQDQLSQQQQLLIRANSTLRRDVLTIFDRTFAITVALRLLATVVAFVGVLNALFLLQFEKKRELGI
ncbi:MAG: ABC transporter permease, partial [Chloroflexi bacterium]|nr:ABC transporter permease [Chloroflexota bacterium]